MQPWLTELTERVDGYAVLADNWDSYGGLAITEAARTVAKRLLEMFAMLPLDRPAVLPTGEGGVALQWYTPDDDDIDVEVCEDGTITYWREDLGDDSRFLAKGQV